MESRLLLAADVAPGSIAGQVTMSVDDSGLESVVLRLLGETGNLLDETQTDAEGNYEFANLSPGIYAVLEIQPPGIRDGGAHVGSGGGVVFDSNLLGEIVVDSGSEFVGYDFFELVPDELSEAGAEESPPLVRHSEGGHSDGEPTQFADAALWQLYGSSPAALASPTEPLELPTRFTSAANYQPSLPATRITPTPFYGSFTHAAARPVAGDENGDSSETLDRVRDNSWQLDFDSWFTATDQGVQGTGEASVLGDWNDSSIDGLEIIREDLGVLDYQGDQEPDQELETKDYDRVFELSEADDQQVRREAKGFKTL